MQGLRIGSAFGIPVKLHWSFLLVLPLFAGLIGSDIATIAELLNELPTVDIDPASLAGTYRPWILGLVAALGLFVGVLLHEFGHSVVALQYGYDIDSITLWLLGGLANFTEMPEDWRHEFLIAVAGPLVSVGVGLSCAVGFVLTPAGSDPILFVFGYLAVLNVGLAVFNMLPAFPMDGGRVLRALLARNQPHAKATQQAADVGKFFAVLLGLVGLLGFNVILILLAFFIYIAASSESQQTVMKAAFEGVTVADIMTKKENLHTVSPDTTVADLIDRMLVERHTGYPVVDGGDIVGMITLDDTQDIKTVERDAYLVSDVMSKDVRTLSADTEAIDALQTLRENNIGRVPVVDDDGVLVGLISRTDLMTAFDVLQTRNRQ
jgi:Zn-dependent protease/CBS domain-containing protein